MSAPEKVKVAHMRLVFYSQADADLEYIRSDVVDETIKELEEHKRAWVKHQQTCSDYNMIVDEDND